VNEPRPLTVRVDTTEIDGYFRKSALDERTSQNRALKWHREQANPIEYLIPRQFRDIGATWPDYMQDAPGHADLTREQLVERVWKLAPWMVPFQLRPGIATIDLDAAEGRQNVANYLFRRDLIGDTVAEALGDDLASSTILDLGCNSGYFSLDLAARGARQVDGLDPRAENIARAQFVQEHYQPANTSFGVGDADTPAPGAQWDVVLNLGVLYHVLDPFHLMRRTYELCRRFAIVDTVVHREPVSAFFLVGDKNTGDPTEGEEEWELHPTYRGAIESMYYAGFSEVIEIVGRAEVEHPLYSRGQRRCFLAVK
jgi:2-polyprenyl-3-methyl-5-hydroxy-6-metoxy-1,4-benzoquinol methylase